MAATGKRAAHRARMREYLELREREGLTFQALSSRTGISAGAFYRWQRVFREEGEPVEAQDPGEPFLELIMGAKASSSPVVREGGFGIFMDGLVLQIPFDFDEEALVRLLVVLRQVC